MKSDTAVLSRSFRCVTSRCSPPASREEDMRCVRIHVTHEDEEGGSYLLCIRFRFKRDEPVVVVGKFTVDELG